MKATKKMLTAVVSGTLSVSDEQSFRAAADAVFIAAASVRDNIQMLTEFAVLHAQDNDNGFSLITYLLNLATGKYGNGVRSATLQEYIEAVVKGGKFVKDAKGNTLFKKETKKTKIKYDLELMNGTKWYEYNNEGVASPKLDFLASLIQQVQKWEKESENEETKYDVKDKEANDKLVASTKAMVNQVAGEEIFVLSSVTSHDEH
jgi:hypothetical protein